MAEYHLRTKVLMTASRREVMASSRGGGAEGKVRVGSKGGVAVSHAALVFKTDHAAELVKMNGLTRRRDSAVMEVVR